MQTEEISYQMAQKRVKRIKGFYTHALVFCVINTMIVIINIQNLGPNETYFQFKNFFTFFSWGIGLVAHAATIFVPNFILGPQWEARKIEALMKKHKQN